MTRQRYPTSGFEGLCGALVGTCPPRGGASRAGTVRPWLTKASWLEQPAAGADLGKIHCLSVPDITKNVVQGGAAVSRKTYVE